MKKTGIILTIGLLAAGSLLMGGQILKAAGQEKRTLLRVGVYDSRAVAIAYADSTYNEEQYQKLKAELDKAQARGDEEKIKAVKEQGSKSQERKHLQGFGTAPVHELLEPVKDKLPAIAAANEVDIIVSKWEFDYLAADAEVKDLTDAVVALFNPGEKQLEWIRQMKDKAPLSEKEILEHQD